jgi:hypothetical protein
MDEEEAKAVVVTTEMSPREQDHCDIKVEVQAQSPVQETPQAPCKPPTFEIEAMPTFEEADAALSPEGEVQECPMAPHRLEYQAFLAEQQSNANESSESLCGADCFPAVSTHRSDQLPYVYDNQLLLCFLKQQQ